MDRLPPLRLLTIFDAVHRLGSMQRAAAELNVTPPAVSQAVRALEEQIGVALLDRSAKPALPSPQGERLARATRDGLGQIADAIEEIRVSAGLADGQVTVSCTLGVATHWLMPRLGTFYARHPEIMVNVQAAPSGLPAFSGGIDIALRYGPEGWPDGWTEKLFDERVCPVGRPRVMAELESPRDLCTAPLIHVVAPGSHGWPGWADYFAGCSLGRPRGARQVFDTYIQAVQAALDGRGVMLGWRSITGTLTAEGRLVPMPGGELDFGTAYWVSCAPGSRRKPAATAFMDWILAEATP